MRIINMVCAVAVLAIVAGCRGQNDQLDGTVVGENIPEIDALFAVWDKPGSPGCSLGIAQDGELIYSRGYGYANLDYDIPMTPQSVVDIASVTKQFVAAMINMLALEGKLSLDDDVRRWLPELPQYDQPVTLRHMIDHTSGLRDYLNLFPLAGRDHYYPISHPQILDMMSRQRELVFTPGERYDYSNTAYMLLAQVIERASGQSIGAFADERIYEPLGMTGSLLYDNYQEIIPRRATGYDRHSDDDIRQVHNFNFDVAGDGQMYSTVEDLLRWDQYLHGPEKPPYYDAMMTEGVLNNGESTGRAQGLGLGEYRGLRTVHHTGSSWGSRTILVRFIKPRLSVAITCNDGLVDTWPLARSVADHLLASQLGPPEVRKEGNGSTSDAEIQSPPPTLTSDGLAEFAGVYFSYELDATYRFAVVDDTLVVRIEQEPPMKVIPLAEDEFSYRAGERAYSDPISGQIEFDRDTDGTITGFRLSSWSERNIEFDRQ